MPLRFIGLVTLLLIVGGAFAAASSRALGSARPTDIFACETGISPSREITLLDISAQTMLPVTRTPGDEYAPAWNAHGTRLTFREIVTQRLDKIWALELGAFTMSVQAGTDARDDAI